MNQKTGTKETSPPVSPRGTITEDTLDVVKREQGVCLSDRQFELNEKKKEMRMKKNQRFRDLVSESPREMKRKERMRRKREAFRLPVAEWEIVKQAFGGRDEDLDSDGDEEGDEGLGLWLKIALRRGRDQRQVEAERSEFGSGGEDDAMSAEVNSPLPCAMADFGSWTLTNNSHRCSSAQQAFVHLKNGPVIQVSGGLGRETRLSGSGVLNLTET